MYFRCDHSGGKRHLSLNIANTHFHQLKGPRRSSWGARQTTFKKKTLFVAEHTAICVVRSPSHPSMTHRHDEWCCAKHALTTWKLPPKWNYNVQITWVDILRARYANNIIRRCYFCYRMATANHSLHYLWL